MLLQRVALANPFVFTQFMQVAAQSEQPVVEIDGYPEYATRIEQLESRQQEQIIALARRIVESHKTNTPIVAFTVHGHADAALRKAPHERAQFEQEVSEQRAAAARNALLTELIKLPRGAGIAAAMPFTSEGFGSRKRKNIPRPGSGLTESEMRQNRRVEFFIAQFLKPLPRKEQPPPKPPEVGTNWRIKIKGGFGVSTILPPPAEDLTVGHVTLFFEITDLDRKERASFRANVTGGVLPGGSFPPNLMPLQTETFTEGKPVDFRTTGGIRLADFVGSVEIAQEPGAGVSVKSFAGNFHFSFTAVENQRIFTRPGVVIVSAGSPVLALPKASLGFAPGIGSITMSSKPSPAP
ncbi:MAG TPA: hypothetical protein VNQ79_03735 [Blastocatellia bacterium]|nr:hypothetical protein [Blastocatellia bacterium]